MYGKRNLNLKRKGKKRSKKLATKQYVKAMISRRIEDKHFHYRSNGALATSPTPVYVCLTGVDQYDPSVGGTDYADNLRIGSEFNPKRLSLNMLLLRNFSSQYNIVRYMIVRTKFPTVPTGGTAGEDSPMLAEILNFNVQGLTEDAAYSLVANRNTEYNNKYDVVYDSKALCLPNTTDVIKRNHVCYKGKGLMQSMKITDDPTLSATNHLWFIAFSYDNTNRASFRLQSELIFEDA